MVWVRILRRLRGIGLSELGLCVSSVLDALMFSVCPTARSAPITICGGIACAKKYKAYFVFRRHTDDVYSVMPEREGDVNHEVLRSLRKGDVFIDVGASIGYYTVLGAKIVGHTGRVLSIEPVPETVKILKRNLALNRIDNVEVFPFAVSNKKGPVVLHVPRDCYGQASQLGNSGDLVRAEAVCLDDVSRSITQIRTIKIDVEGAEYEVLLGAKETLRKTDTVIVEFSRNAPQAKRLLEKLSFTTRPLKFTHHVMVRRKHSARGI